MPRPLEPFPFERRLAQLAHLLVHPAFDAPLAPPVPERRLWFRPLPDGKPRRVRTYGRGLIHGIVAGAAAAAAFSFCFLVVMG